MRKEDIISKGKYSYPQPEGLISVKEYLFVRNEEGKKMLLLRFSNQRAEACTSFGFILYRLDARGRVLGEERFESSNDAKYRPNSTFGFDRKIEVEEKCVEFKIKLLYASYGEYQYKVENGASVVDFEEKGKVARPSSSGTGEKIKPRKITHRALETPGLFAVITLVILAIAFLITGFQLRKFMDEEIEFTLAGLKYEFVDEDKKEPGDDVLIVGATERYENVLIPSEIEGYTVVGIKEGAFKGDKTLKNVKIEGVNIGKEVFLNCENLESVEFIGVTSVGERAFYGCDSLKEIKANSLESVGREAFGGCKSLRKVNFTGAQSSVIKIGENAFNGCMSLENVTISRFIDYSENVAIFAGATGIKNLSIKNFMYDVLQAEIPDEPSDEGGFGGIGGIIPFSSKQLSLMDLYGNVNANDIKLESLTIEYINEIPMEFCIGLGNLRSVKITKSNVTKIPDRAFYGCVRLEEIDLSKVTEIGEGAFYECEKLKETKITADTPLATIGASAFYGCSSLDSIIVPPTVTNIGSKAFANCSIEVFEFPAGLENYGKEILSGCFNIKELTLPSLSNEVLTYIFGSNKYGNYGELISAIPTSLKKVKVQTCTEVPANAFKNCASLEKIELPNTVTEIGNNAFLGCTSLKEFDIPKSTVKIGTGAFKNSGIEKIDLSGVTEIGKEAFFGCNKMKEITVPFIGGNQNDPNARYFSYIFGATNPASSSIVPESLEKITVTGTVEKLPAYAFYNCSGLKTIVLQTSVKEIGEYAFAYCTALSAFDLSSATSIGKSAFEGTSLKEITFSSQITEIPSSIFKNNQKLEKVTLGSSVTKIGSYAFDGCISLSEINSPASLREIGEKAFSDAGNLEKFNLEYVTSVGAEAFRATAIKEVVLPQNAEVGSGAFTGCDSLQSLTMPLASGEYIGYYFETNNEYIPSSLRTLRLMGTGSLSYGAVSGCKYIEELYLEGYTSIASYSAGECYNLRFVQVPSTVASVSTSSFTGSYKLYEINNKSTVRIVAGSGTAQYALYVGTERAPRVEKNGTTISCYNGTWYITRLPNTETVAVPSSFEYNGEKITSISIPQNLMRGEATISEITFPASISSVGIYAFYSAPSLKSVYFDDASAVTQIPSGAFYSCGNLKEVALPDSVTDIGYQAFYSCTELETVSMPDSLETINNEAFYGCSSLPQIVLGSRLSSIGSRAFYGCSRLYDVYNVSSLSVRAGSTDNGYVARYALKVHTNLADLPSDEVYVDGIGTFRNKDNEWLLISYDGTSSELDLRNIKINGKTITSFRIAEGVFQYNTYLEKVIAGSSLKQIQSGAFVGCYNLVSVDLEDASLEAIEERTFVDCTSLRYAYLPDSVKEIKDEAFYGCTKLEEISMPANLVSIGARAFSRCSRLISIEIPSNVNFIGSYAFESCTSLYEIINKSGLYLNENSSSFGAVAYYAKGIFSSASAGFERKTVNGCKLILIDGTWYLYSTEAGLDKTLVDIDVTGGSLVIKKDAFFGANVRKIILPISTTQIESGALQHISSSLQAVYYKGTADEFYNIMGNYYITSSTYFYGDCVHDYTTWTYKDGQVSTEECTLKYTTEKEATCFEAGYEVGRCECGCGYEVTNDLAQLSHNFVNGACVNCNLKKVNIDGTSAESLAEDGIIVLNQVIFNEENSRFETTIQGQPEGVAKFMIVAPNDTEVTITYGVSCESYYDKLIVSLNGIQIDKLSGIYTYSKTLSLTEGDILTFEYSKDTSGDRNEDLAFFENITILVKTEQQ